MAPLCSRARAEFRPMLRARSRRGTRKREIHNGASPVHVRGDRDVAGDEDFYEDVLRVSRL